MNKLNSIYHPIKKELENVEEVLETSFKESKNESVLKLNRFLLESPGKRIRPALVILSSRATLGKGKDVNRKELIRIASAMELIHLASLIHDDVIDHSYLRHHRPTINVKFGQDVSIALGDYLYAQAFDLISSSGNMDILSCISSATQNMCEGELIQVCERDNLSLLKERYILIVKKKTASLFAASCQAGAMASQSQRHIQSALKEYGLNFGIAFQIIDDCLDLISQEKELGKTPGTDFKMGELTLPILNLLTLSKDKKRIISLIRHKHTQKAFSQIRQGFINSDAFMKTKEDTHVYINKAKRSLDRLPDHCFKQSLIGLADYIIKRLIEYD